MKDWFATKGSPSPLGGTWVPADEAFNFALYSKHATAVTLLLYAKNAKLRERGIGFEDIVFHIERGDLLEILEHPKPER